MDINVCIVEVMQPFVMLRFLWFPIFNYYGFFILVQ